MVDYKIIWRRRKFWYGIRVLGDDEWIIGARHVKFGTETSQT